MAFWVACFWLYMGAGTTFGPDKWRTAEGYYVIRQFMPLKLWGIIFLAIGVSQLAALYWHERRLPLVLGAAVAATWAASFITAALIHKLTGAGGPGLWGLVAINQTILAGYPRKVTRRWHLLSGS